jgi:pimeloyl-ACP methyl ester carboxylesterase
VVALVLVGTTSRVSERVAGWYERIARAGEREGLEGIRRAIGADGSRRPRAGDAPGIARMTRVLAQLCADPLTPRLREIMCPALVLVGEKDPMGAKASETLARELGSGTLEVVPGCGHWVHVDAPAAFVASLDGWLGGRPAERGDET